MDPSTDPLPPDQRALITQALRSLMRLAPQVHALLARRVGIGSTDLSALDQLTISDAPVGVVELGDRLGIRSASATVLVDRMVAAGHLSREPDPADGRRRVVQVTEHARREMFDVLWPLIQGIRQVTDQLDQPSGQIVLDYLQQVCAVLETLLTGEPPGPQPLEDSTSRD